MKSKIIRFLSILFASFIILTAWSFSRSGAIDSVYFKPALVTLVFFLTGLIMSILKKKLSVLEAIILFAPSAIIMFGTWYSFKNMFLHDIPLLPFWALVSGLVGFYSFQKMKRYTVIIGLLFIAITSFVYSNTIPSWDYFVNQQQNNFGNLYTQKIQHSLLSKDSSTKTLDAYKGKLVFLDFYTNGCSPCIEQLPFLISLSKKFPKNKFEVLLINTGTVDKYNYSKIFENKNFANKGITNLYDTEGRLSKHLSISGVPQQFLLDKDGNVIHYTFGSSAFSEVHKYSELEKLIRKNI